MLKGLFARENKHYLSSLSCLILIILLILFCIIRAFSFTILSDFNPINGDFQNYNPFRRLLEGQIPFKDFSVYLGLGHLYSGSLLLRFFGSNFTISLFSVAFMTTFFLILWAFGTSYIILKDKVIALLFTNFIILLALHRINLFGTLIPSDFSDSFKFGLAAGNSARMIRGAVPILIAMLLLFGSKVLNRLQHNRSLFNWLNVYNSLIKKSCAALVSGVFITWSNDYGVASYICFSLVYLLIIIKIYNKSIGKIFLSIFLYIVVSIIGCIIVLTLVTRGHPYEWFAYTIGVSQYQSWYYGSFPEVKSFFVYNTDNSFFTFLTLGLALIYFYKLLKASKHEDEILRYGLPAYLLLTGWLAANMYKLLSGGLYRETTYLILFLVILSECLQFLRSLLRTDNLIKIKRAIIISIVLLATTNIVTEGITITSSKMFLQRNASYIDGLQGYVTSLAPSLNSAEERTRGGQIFATYASAIETINNQFQPTGIDYIIHALGDRKRADYLEVFREGDFQYAATIRNNYSPYEYWIRNANWFFYRELYDNYNVSFANSYELFWEKSNKKNLKKLPMSVSTEKLNNSSYRVNIKMDDLSVNGTADVELSYRTDFNQPFFKTLAFRRMVFVQEITEFPFVNAAIGTNPNFFIPPKSDGYYIPITIVNGQGEVILESYPKEHTDFFINKLEVKGIFDEPFGTLILEDLTDENWENGMSKTNSIFLMRNTFENRIALQNVDMLEDVDGRSIKVEKVIEVDNYLHIYIAEQKDLSMFAYPNAVKVVTK
ncbi:MAG: hypothetical protein K0R57_2120 [Paenibacillaceae bacterium]|jgi:hypothetical protein|nr:hypothetical protein [Paenibacillaceae bacterium]